MSIISENIKRLRIKADMEQLELAKRLQVSNKTVSSWECGRTEPRMGMIERICQVFNCSKSDIIEEQPTVIIGNNATTNRLLAYAEKLGAIPPEARDRILHMIDYEIEKNESKKD